MAALQGPARGAKDRGGETGRRPLDSLAALLKEHRTASRYSTETDFVFASAPGRPMDGRNIAERGLRAAGEAAGLIAARPPKKGSKKATGRKIGTVQKAGEAAPLTMHVLRHHFGSLLIAADQDLAFVSGQMGHANPSITAKVYVHEFEAQRRHKDARAVLEASFGSIVQHGMQHESDFDQIPGDSPPEAGVVDMQAFRATR